MGIIHRAVDTQYVVSLKEKQHSNLRQKIVDIVQKEIGVQEATSNNDGARCRGLSTVYELRKRICLVCSVCELVLWPSWIIRTSQPVESGLVSKCANVL